MAARFKAFARLLFFSFDEEPENRYHANPGTYTLASFTAAYQRIHSRFASAGVQNVVWVWNVTGTRAMNRCRPEGCIRAMATSIGSAGIPTTGTRAYTTMAGGRLTRSSPRSTTGWPAAV
jgi:hypothetical protein